MRLNADPIRWPKPIAESALVVLVPEAESLVETFRDKHDPAAAAGIPAHITLLYPFKPPDEIDDVVCKRLQSIFTGFQSFDYTINASRRFPQTLYLTPEPGDLFRNLTLSIWKFFPETPPYESRHPDIIPHLTVASLANEKQLDVIEKNLTSASKNKLPLQAYASKIALIDNQSGRWRTRAKFNLAGNKAG